MVELIYLQAMLLCESAAFVALSTAKKFTKHMSLGGGLVSGRLLIHCVKSVEDLFPLLFVDFRRIYRVVIF